MADKLYQFSKKEVYFLKKILPTCKLTAYQISLYQSVMESLESPFILPTVTHTNQVDPIPNPIPISQNESSIPDNNTFLKSPGVSHIRTPETPKVTLEQEESILLEEEPTIIPPPVVESEEPESIFGVIDKRSK